MAKQNEDVNLDDLFNQVRRPGLTKQGDEEDSEETSSE